MRAEPQQLRAQDPDTRSGTAGSSCCKRAGSAKTVRRRCWCKAKASIATWCSKSWHGWRNRLPSAHTACGLWRAPTSRQPVTLVLFRISGGRLQSASAASTNSHRLFGRPGQSPEEGLTASTNKSLAQISKSLDWPKRLRSEKAAPHAFLGSNEATYGLREGGAGFHRNRPGAGKAKPTLSAGIVRRVRNADDVR